MQLEQLGPYRLGKQLGQGGMGAVYEGVHVETGEAAAVKVLSPALAVNDGFRGRFEAEIESLKKLRHPNIVRLLGYGEQSGTLFYVMELVPGTSLEDELRRGRRFDWREVTHIAIKLCRALKHAHDHGVIHRDLKPANLLMTPDGDVKLSDFGIARLFGNTRLTSDGGVLGTAEYMAPEQADGRTVTDRCDQYSLGGVMYTLLAGRPPFRATTLVEMLQLQRYAEPEPLDSLAPQTPAELVRIVHQLLQKDPQKRFPNALMVSRSLEAMERALSVLDKQDGGDVTPPPMDILQADSGDYDPAAPTLSPDELSGAARGTRTPLTSPQATRGTMAYRPNSKQPPPPKSADETAKTAADRFTKVDERRDEHSAVGDALANLLAPQTLTLVLALVLLVGGGWYMMQPPSADDLFNKIEAAVAAGDPRTLEAAQHDIDEFLDRYPNDRRAEKVQTLSDKAEQSTPIARAYAEAMRSILSNPEQALARFQAIIDVYDDGDSGVEITQHYVRLSRLQRARIEKRVARYVEQGRTLIESRLAKADERAADDAPQAERIYRGIVELYHDKPWADDLVERARRSLQDAETRQAAAK